MKDKIINLMKSEGLTPSRLAEILEIQPSGISHLVSGRNKPGFDLLQKILARFPRINPDWLLLDSDQMYRVDATSHHSKNMNAHVEPTPPSRQEDVVSVHSDFGGSGVISVDDSQGVRLVENSAVKTVHVKGQADDYGDVSIPAFDEPILNLFESVATDPESVADRVIDVERRDEKLSVNSKIDLKKPRVVKVLLFYDDNTCESFDMR